MSLPGIVRVACLLLCLAAVEVSAAAFYYHEVEKDGRIYVFSQAEEHERWARTGEVGKSITRLGYGPSGETVVFDGEDAIQLYNFKHGLPGEAFPRPSPPTLKISWRDGKTSIETDRALLRISNRVQFRFTHEDPDASQRLAGTPAAGDARGSFRIRRAKTKLEGWFLSKRLGYELQLNWADTASGLEDALLAWDVSGNNAFQVKLGQYKVPFGRQELTSSGSQQFVDRSIVSNEFAKGRDVGLMLQGLVAGEKLDYRLGVFNGNGRNKSANDNDAYQLDARLAFQPNGDAKYSEVDFDSKDRPLWALAAGFEANSLHRTSEANDLEREVYAFDGVFKYRGVFVTGELYLRRLTPETGASFRSDGWHVQGGYLLPPARKVELALRWASWDPNHAVAGNDRTELGAALSYYHDRHGLKVQTDVRRLEDQARDSRGWELRAQAQFVF